MKKKLPDTPLRPPEPVENYIGCAIDEDLQRRLGLYVAKHAEMTEEEAIVHLLHLALDRVEVEEEGDAPTIARAGCRARLSILRRLTSAGR
jgi:hypothetical protein